MGGGVAAISFLSALLSRGKGARRAWGGYHCQGAGLAATAWRSAWGRALVVVVYYHYSAWLTASAVLNALVALASVQRIRERIGHAFRGGSDARRRARAVLPVRLEPHKRRNVHIAQRSTYT